MQQRKLLFYLISYALLSSAAAICLTSALFASLTHGYAQGLAETALRWAGLLCACAAALVLMVYAAHAAKSPAEKLPFPAACRRAIHTALLLLCMLPALLLLSVLQGLYSWFVFPFFSDTGQNIFPALVFLLAAVPALVRLFLLPLALHPLLLLLTEPQPIPQIFRTALHTWKAQYKTLLLWCAAVMAAQTAVSLLLRFAAQALFSTGASISLIAILFSGVLQALLLYRLLVRYTRSKPQLKQVKNQSL